jgi:hypothetical protein
VSEIVIPAPIDCVWVGDDLFGDDTDPVEGTTRMAGRVGHWLGHDKMGDDVNPAIVGVREPMWVLCPMRLRKYTDRTVDPPVEREDVTGTPFCIDHYSSVKHQLWDVTVDMDSLVIGQKPKITVHPSIHLVGIWHGWLQDGVLHQ